MTTPLKAKFVREKIRPIDIEFAIVKLKQLLEIEAGLLGDGRLDGMGERMSQADTLHECIMHHTNELLILVQDSDIVKN